MGTLDVRMTHYTAFLRGMNIGGRRITNADLCGCFETLGFSGVAAFLASGNVVFESRANATTVERKVSRGLAEQLGYAVPTFIRSAAEVRAVAARDPFRERPGSTSRGKLQVAFLERPPDPAALAVVAERSDDEDWLEIEGRELYWRPRGGLSESALNVGALERQIGQMTIRTTRTVERLAAKFFSAA